MKKMACTMADRFTEGFATAVPTHSWGVKRR